MKFKKWFRRISIFKYPAVFIIFMWGAVPALQPGVSGLKSHNDLFDSRYVKKIELSKIALGSHVNPSWCVEDRWDGMDGGRTFAACGFEDDHGRIAREMNWDGPWSSGPKTIYKVGNIVDYSSASDDVMDIARDWEWLEFFYGYGTLSGIGAALLSTAYFQIRVWFAAWLAILLFIVFDVFVLAFILCRLLLKKIRMGKGN